MSLNRITRVLLSLVMAGSAFAQNVGSTFCTQGSNSTGVSTTLVGSLRSGGSRLHLEARQGVPGELGYFLAGNEATAGLAVGNGLLCLVGTGTSNLFPYSVAGGELNSIGRFDAAGVLQNIAGTSTIGTGFDVPSALPNGVPITIMSGDTWHYQLWHRDTPAASGASNFSNGLSVTFPVESPIAGMVVIPAGTFSMGSDGALGAPLWRSPDEAPVHVVTISQQFWMGATEVTQAQYRALMGLNPSDFIGGNRPVEQVTWFDARAYCMALTARERAAGMISLSLEYRLPTEAEWEYACRAGTTTEYITGADLTCSDAQIGSTQNDTIPCGSTSTADVASYAPNAWGLFDMHGNVWEWCLDNYVAYAAGPVADPFSNVGSDRVLRGGGWFNAARHCRSSRRLFISPAYTLNFIGFRIVLSGVLTP